MKSKILSIVLCGAIVMKVSGQSDFVVPTVPPGQCMTNSFDPVVPSFRNDIRKSVFTFSNGIGQCTGTLINRNTSEQNLGTYFVSSWHCFKTGETCGGSEFDFNKHVTFRFNFQSPPNQLFKVFKDNVDGAQYKITRQIRLVDHISCAYGDFVICEILGAPIPPHFLPYYAGWKPSGFYSSDDFIQIHHPNGSLKQASMTNFAADGYKGNVSQKVCQTITKSIDFLVGWVWGRKWSTETICPYVQVPYIDTRLIVNKWSTGHSEVGSSGSSLFDKNNRIVGTFSGLSATCGQGQYWFGKLPSYYPRGAIKNALNPPNTWAVDQIGVPGRYRSCYEVIDYNYGVPYSIYPTSDYQNDEPIILNSRTDISLGKDFNNIVNIMYGANVVANANGNIELGPGFQVMPGATFTANTGVTACNYSGSYRLEETDESNYEAIARAELFARMNEVIIPEQLDLTSKLPTREMAIYLYPNPSNNYLTVHSAYVPSSTLEVTLFNSMGEKKYQTTYEAKRASDFDINISFLSNGLYTVVLKSGDHKTVQKIVIEK